MKTSNLVIRIAMAALLLCVLIYFSFYIASSFSGGLTTVLAYSDSADVGIEASGLVIRQEQALSAQLGSATVDLSPSEGERVAKGDVVATLYASAAGLETKHSIRTLEAEIEQLEYALRASASGADAAMVENELASSIAAFHAASASGDLSGLENRTLQLRTLIFKRDYTYGDTVATQELQALINSKTGQLNSLRASLGAVSTVVYAPCSGVFSALADGLEDQLTPDILERITPSQLSALRSRSAAPPAGAIGKLITSSTWYYAALVREEDAAQLRVGRRYPIRFSHDYSGQITMKLERISDGEDGRCALVFSCRSSLGDITLLRRQTTDIVTEKITGIRVPRSALRALTETVKDEQTGEETQVTVTGVYTLLSRQARFNPVNVLYQGEDFFLVEPTDPDAVRRLREGDEVIVYTAGVTDGKVLR